MLCKGSLRLLLLEYADQIDGAMRARTRSHAAEKQEAAHGFRMSTHELRHGMWRRTTRTADPVPRRTSCVGTRSDAELRHPGAIQRWVIDNLGVARRREWIRADVRGCLGE